MVSQLGCNLLSVRKLKYFTSSFKHNCLWVSIDTFSTFLIPDPSRFKTFPRRQMYSTKHSLLQFPSTGPPWKAKISQLDCIDSLSTENAGSVHPLCPLAPPRLPAGKERGGAVPSSVSLRGKDALPRGHQQRPLVVPDRVVWNAHA